jgi:hypothetical protein
MGRLRYDSHSDPIEIEDRELAHLKVVMGTKLRRQESFMMTWHPADGSPHGTCTAWIHPAIPLQFLFDSPKTPRVDTRHVATLMESVNATGDLVLGHLIPKD